MLNFDFIFDDNCELQKNVFADLIKQMALFQVFNHKTTHFQESILLTISHNSLKIGLKSSYKKTAERTLHYPVHWKSFKDAINTFILEQTHRNVVTLGQDFTLHNHKRHLLTKDLTIDLTEKECELLVFLAENIPSASSKEALLESVWGMNAELDTHTVETHVYRLRQKLSDHGLGEQLNIETTSEGYVLKINPDLL